MAIERYQPTNGGGIVPLLFDLGQDLLVKGATAWYWLTDVAPVLSRAQLVKLGWQGIDQLPYISAKTRSDLKERLLEGLLG